MEQYYTTGRICQILGIRSKMTLVRLEKRGIISPPPVRLQRNGERRYSPQNFEQVKKYWETTRASEPEQPAPSPSHRGGSSRKSSGKRSI